MLYTRQAYSADIPVVPEPQLQLTRAPCYTNQLLTVQLKETWEWQSNLAHIMPLVPRLYLLLAPTVIPGPGLSIIPTSPLSRLPYDIWFSCLQFTIGDSADGPLPYLMVSTHWSDCILASPGLWTTIVINGGEDELVRIYTFLQLSRPLFLNVICESGLNEESLRIVATEHRRVRSLRCSPLFVHPLPRSPLIRVLDPDNKAYTMMSLLDFGHQVSYESVISMLESTSNLRVLRGALLQPQDEGIISPYIEELTLRILPRNTCFNFDPKTRFRVLGLQHDFSEEGGVLQTMDTSLNIIDFKNIENIINVSRSHLQILRVSFDFQYWSSLVHLLSLSSINVLHELSINLMFKYFRKPTNRLYSATLDRLPRAWSLILGFQVL